MRLRVRLAFSSGRQYISEKRGPVGTWETSGLWCLWWKIPELFQRGAGSGGRGHRRRCFSGSQSFHVTGTFCPSGALLDGERRGCKLLGFWWASGRLPAAATFIVPRHRRSLELATANKHRSFCFFPSPRKEALRRCQRVAGRETRDTERGPRRSGSWHAALCLHSAPTRFDFTPQIHSEMNSSRLGDLGTFKSLLPPQRSSESSPLSCFITAFMSYGSFL